MVSENEADWYAHKALLLRLREFPDLEQRRDFVAGSMSFFCGYEYNYFSEDQQEDLIELEDELTELMFGGGSSGHADSSDRLLGILTTEMADTLQCVAPPTLTREQSYQGCRL